VTELERPGGVKPVRAPKRERRWLWLVVGIFAVGAKVEAVGALLAHRTGVIVAAAVGLVLAVLRPTPVAIAGLGGVLLACAVGPPFLAGGGIALGAFVLLMTLFYGAATVLHARQDRRATRARG
jgi:hypothetical protein